MADVYQILEWDRFFENNKSRLIDLKSWAAVPNKQHGMGLTFILSQSDGAAVYGIWCLILGACSQQRRPRDGWLTDDGKSSGRPWSVKALATRWRRPDKEIARTLELLISPEVAWMRSNKCPSSALVVPPNGQTKEGRKEGIEGAQPSTAACPESDVPTSGPADAVVLAFPVVGPGPKNWNLRESFVAKLSSTYPAVDVLAESREALLWVEVNPRRAKTPDGMNRFLSSWMKRTQNRGGANLAAAGAPFSSRRADELDPTDAAMIEKTFGGSR